MSTTRSAARLDKWTLKVVVLVLCALEAGKCSPRGVRGTGQHLGPLHQLEGRLLAAVHHPPPHYHQGHPDQGGCRAGPGARRPRHHRVQPRGETAGRKPGLGRY